MRRKIAGLLIVTLVAVAGWAGGRYSRPVAPTEVPASFGIVEYDVPLARVSYLPPLFVAGERLPQKIGSQVVSRIEFEGKTFWLVDLHTGLGVPYKSIGLYAPNGDEKHYTLCLEVESCGAGSIKPELDATTGILQLREHAWTDLKGQIILSCNLRSVGNFHSVYEK